MTTNPQTDPLAVARATNQRLNLRAQQLESELAAYRRAVRQWEINDQMTYVPLRSLAVIAKAAGLAVPERWELHYQRVERLEAAAVSVPASAPTDRAATCSCGHFPDPGICPVDHDGYKAGGHCVCAHDGKPLPTTTGTGLRDLLIETLTSYFANFSDEESARINAGEAAGAVLVGLLGAIPADIDVASWTAIRAIQLMNEAGREAEEQRLALSQALGLGTNAPWDAIRDRAVELAAVAPVPADRAEQCVCGEPTAPDAVHRTDEPCYIDNRIRVIALAIARVDIHQWADGEPLEDKPLWQAYLGYARAVLTVLPTRADRAAILHEAVDQLSRVPFTHVLTELRRMAAAVSGSGRVADETQAETDLADRYGDDHSCAESGCSGEPTAVVSQPAANCPSCQTKAGTP